MSDSTYDKKVHGLEVDWDLRSAYRERMALAAQTEKMYPKADFHSLSTGQGDECDCEMHDLLATLNERIIANNPVVNLSADLDRMYFLDPRDVWYNPHINQFGLTNDGSSWRMARMDTNPLPRQDTLHIPAPTEDTSVSVDVNKESHKVVFDNEDEKKVTVRIIPKERK